MPDPDIYELLAAHQRTEDWRWKDHLREFQRWAGILDSEFKLEVPHVSLCLEHLRCSRFGHFRPGHNGFGLRGEIALNVTYVRERAAWETLGTLLHELLHGWQDAHGRPGKGNYHNKELQVKALDLGLLIDGYGHTQYLPESPFVELLRRYGVNLPALAAPVTEPKSPGNSKLKKWSCGCPVNVRVAIRDFRARCLECGETFRLMGDRRGSYSEFMTGEVSGKPDHAL